MDVNAVFRRNLARLRCEQGLSPARLSRAAGVGINTVYAVEAARSGTTLHVAAALAAALGVSLEAMITPGGLTRAGNPGRENRGAFDGQ